MQREEDMPRDPDYDAVPRELLASDGRVVVIVDADGVVEEGALVIAPALFGHSKRLREGFFDGLEDDAA